MGMSHETPGIQSILFTAHTETKVHRVLKLYIVLDTLKDGIKIEKEHNKPKITQVALIPPPKKKKNKSNSDAHVLDISILFLITKKRGRLLTSAKDGGDWARTE